MSKPRLVGSPIGERSQTHARCRRAPAAGERTGERAPAGVHPKSAIFTCYAIGATTNHESLAFISLGLTRSSLVDVVASVLLTHVVVDHLGAEGGQRAA